MSFKTYKTNRLVKGEDLNHHGTLYAGRTAEWFVESGFVSAANLTNPENIVCLQIHNMQFSHPVRKGEVVCLESRIVHAGNTSLVAHIHMSTQKHEVLEGFITFIHVDKDGKPVKHGITIEPSTEAEQELQKRATQLKRMP
ncbi:MAG: acyl-CoA thioesterase [Anaerolineaceae bacterium]|nr:acyl-CoA thioesterase [Anaerolineaceae bacterium]